MSASRLLLLPPPQRLLVCAVGAVATHITLSAISVIIPALNNLQPPPPPPPPSEALPPSKTSALVSQLYSGSPSFSPLSLSPACTFHDPVALCVGRAEVSECFRALRVACAPEHLSEPVPFHRSEDPPAPEGGRAEFFYLNQRYFGFLSVASVLRVDTGPDGLVTAIEERWNGRPLLPLSWCRRVNGVASCLLTPIVARE
ncbi:hypothetical protein TeGR_g6047 [Tetraparma gracilis]|uniref:Uncharacterized protein n=1 Tax=Tetraparma gracilis TaxID=2962635 RepID=A0ABQ6MEW0_9STRA|nr:hypothetical protein TeGR_g6047 [Tetraparma gracilis]